MSAVPWPTLDGPDAERAIAAAVFAAWTGGEDPYRLSYDAAIAALNDPDVVLCDHDALAALRQRAIDAEADLRALLLALENEPVSHRVRCFVLDLGDRHDLTADPKGGTR